MIGFVLPTYNKFVYARKAAETFFAHTPDGHVVLVDDGSPLYGLQNWPVWSEGFPQDRLHVIRFEKNEGLTRGWNVGLAECVKLGLKYLIAGNSDVVFTPGWHVGLCRAIDAGWNLVGPVTNCPGWTNKGRQHVKHFFPGYQVSDAPADLAAVAAHLSQTRFDPPVVESLINGFFQMADRDSWTRGMFDYIHYYDPKNKMTGNEDELQARWLRLGFRIGFVPSSYILHYRAVTRGDRHKHGDWLRMV